MSNAIDNTITPLVHNLVFFGKKYWIYIMYDNYNYCIRSIGAPFRNRACESY